MPDRSALLTAEQAATLLNVKPAFVLSLARRDAIPHVRLGARYVRFDPDELETWWRERARGPRG